MIVIVLHGLQSVKISIYYFLFISETPNIKGNCKNQLHTHTHTQS